MHLCSLFMVPLEIGFLSLFLTARNHTNNESWLSIFQLSFLGLYFFLTLILLLLPSLAYNYFAMER